jgi:hypothetical protein
VAGMPKETFFHVAGVTGSNWGLQHHKMPLKIVLCLHDLLIDHFRFQSCAPDLFGFAVPKVWMNFLA